MGPAGGQPEHHEGCCVTPLHHPMLTSNGMMSKRVKALLGQRPMGCVHQTHVLHFREAQAKNA